MPYSKTPSRIPPAVKDKSSRNISQSSHSGSSKPRFFYTTGGDQIRIWMMELLTSKASQFIGLVCAPGDSIVDTAAEDGCVGFTQLPKILQSLRPHGLQWVWADRPEAAQAICSGVLPNIVGYLWWTWLVALPPAQV